MGLVGTALATGKFSAALGIALAGATGGLGLSLLMSRPLYTRWLTTYVRARAHTIGATHASTRGNASVAAVVNQLAGYAKSDAQLAPVYRAIAEENGLPVDDRLTKPESNGLPEQRESAELPTLPQLWVP